jgi:hypothetical protein
MGRGAETARKANSPGNALEGWKAIAGYLRVTERAVQKWEKERGLPIHRHRSFDAPRVLAYTHELDEWRRREKRGISAVLASRRGRILLFGGILPALGVVVLVGYLLSTRAGPPAYFNLRGDWLDVEDSRRRLLWSARLPEIDPVVRAANYSRSATNLIEDVDGDGEAEVLIDCPTAPQLPSRSRLICFSETGRVRWEHPYGDALTFRGQSIPCNYRARVLRLIRTREQTYLLSIAAHRESYFSHVVLLNPATGRVADTYVHPGWIFEALVEDLDRDGAAELLLAGVNNPGAGVGVPALIVLGIPFSVVKPKPGARSSEFYPLTGGRERSYCLLPQTDLTEGELQIARFALEGERILLKLSMQYGEVSYAISRDFRTVEARASDLAVAKHQMLTQQRRRDHSLSEAELRCWGRLFPFDTAPDGNAFAESAQGRCPPAP